MNNKGFTLLEVLVVCAIVGILAGVAFLTTRSMREGYQFRGAARAVYSDMQMARLGAIKGGTNWALCFSANGTFNAYSIRSDPGPDLDLCTADDPTPYRKSVNSSGLYAGITYVENFTGTEVFFTPRGTSVTGNVTLSNPSRSIQVIVNGMTGSIRIQ